MKASNECKVKRIIYLGGLTYGPDEELSQHMLIRYNPGSAIKPSQPIISGSNLMLYQVSTSRSI